MSGSPTIRHGHRERRWALAAAGGAMLCGRECTKTVLLRIARRRRLQIGSAHVAYQITAVRSTSGGNPAQDTVNFGTGGGGGLSIASITQDELDEGGSVLKQAA